ncbi:MAG TPA: histidine kinase [Longimicrobiales bacterium]|nr:histidine kinase [Longimicrobiales bacterium]
MRQRNRDTTLTLVQDDGQHARRPEPVRLLLRVPLFYKILIANVAILALVTGACAAITHGPGTASSGELGLVLVGGVLASVLVNALLLRVALRPLQNLERTAARVQAGDLAARVARSPVADRDLDRLAVTFNAMLDSADVYRRRLRDVTARALNAAEEERKRIARELHDGTAQTLAALLVQLRVARTSGDDETRGRLLERIGADISAATEEIRHIARGLRPPALDMLGLGPAIESCARTVAELTELHVETDIQALEGRLTPEAELALYRIIQEALSNAARHSGATTARVLLHGSGRNAVAVVADDGIGFVVADEMARGGLGLFGMQERGAYVGATVDIDSEPGRGTRIRVTIPVVETARYA